MPASKTSAKPRATAAPKAASAKATPAATAAKAKAKAPAAKPAAKTAPAAAAEAEAAAKVRTPGLKLKELVARVSEQSDAPKKLQREVSEAVLAVLGAALLAGEEINLPGFGRAKVVKSLDKAGSQVLTVKIRNAGQKKSDGRKEALADDGEDS
ncbi:hypothetical protein HOY34_11485 [Xinfangfangia sp. D13-10-4-6]|uniref:HU family DNA-binding protein n=1 Tax=Pseudogemmobacter hezensis TaxID=2737662 RepID=UPI001552D047|nr:HU family DNA-binding protein [Pseudogemmobacter hezensis]NPD15821.1 hypothetical protein [Pseudogemmobacter hezensis]